VVFPAGPGTEVGATVAALGRQTRAPDRVEVLDRADRVPRAMAGECEWLWLLDGGTLPQPGALEQLLAALERADPAPVLLSSKVERPDGSLDERSLPIPEVFRADQALAALERRALAVRIARRGSLLVRRRALADFSAASPLRDDIGWTARLLKHEPGLMVPASVVVRPPGGRAGGRAEVAAWLRLAGGDAIEPRERPWFAFRAADRAWAQLRGRAAGLGQRP